MVDQAKTVSKKEQATDPVCSMSTDSPDSWLPYEYQGETYHFCSEHCLKEFQDNPEQYVHVEEKESEDVSPPREEKGSVHTCPMHPEIREKNLG